MGLFATYVESTPYALTYFIFVSISFLTIYLINNFTLFYGRITIAVSAIPSLIASYGIYSLFSPAETGVLYFLAVIGGITAYNITTTPKDVTVFVIPLQVLCSIMIVLMFSPPTKVILFGQEYTIGLLVYLITIVLFAVCIVTLEYKWEEPPDITEVLSGERNSSFDVSKER